MAISINGTTGIAGVDGSAGTPALQGSDTNTGISFASDVILGSTGGTERFRVDSSGRLLIGTTAPTVSQLFVAGGSFSVSGSDTNFNAGGQRAFIDLAGGTARIGACHGGGAGSMALEFYANTSNRVGGFSATGVFDAYATESKATNGYVKLPSGIIMQWGQNFASTGGTTSSFPIAFPNAAWVLVGVNNNQTNPPAPSCSIISLSQFTLTVTAGGPTVNWIALGY